MMRKLTCCLAGLMLTVVASSAAAAQTTLPTRKCPSDHVPTKTDQGITFTGTSAQAYVESFLSGDPTGVARVSTSTSGLTPSMIAILNDAVEADRTVCTRLNYFLSNGESPTPLPPWVYFRADRFYFVTRWTEPPVSGGRFHTFYGTIMVFDSDINLLGVWTA